VEVPYSLMEELHVTPPQSSIAEVDVRWATFWMTANQSAWSELPEEIRQVIVGVHRQHVRNYRKEIAEHNRAARSRLNDAGIQFTRLPAAELRTRLIEEGFYARWRGEFGETTWKLIKQATGRTPDEVTSA
jgi:TRAP-type C4-dicarboxylate transport system substrate-binding protein